MEWDDIRGKEGEKSSATGVGPLPTSSPGRGPGGATVERERSQGRHGAERRPSATPWPHPRRPSPPRPGRPAPSPGTPPPAPPEPVSIGRPRLSRRTARPPTSVPRPAAAPGPRRPRSPSVRGRSGERGVAQRPEPGTPRLQAAPSLSMVRWSGRGTLGANVAPPAESSPSCDSPLPPRRGSRGVLAADGRLLWACGAERGTGRRRLLRAALPQGGPAEGEADRSQRRDLIP